MSNKMFYPICLVLVLALAGFAQAELLVNPDFEDGLDSWSAWGGGSGSDAGGYFWDSSYHADVMEDGTAHGGDKYVAAGLPDNHTGGWWWSGMWVYQEHAVTEGKEYQISAWVRNGDRGVVTEGLNISFEWRDKAPLSPTSPDGERGVKVDLDGDGTGDNDVINYPFDLSDDWTQISATEVCPTGYDIQGITVAFLASAGVNFDIDDASFVEVEAPTPSNYVTSTDQGGLIPIVNQDFQEPNDGKHTAFDIETSRKDTFEPFFGVMTTDVPGWSTDTSMADSGIEWPDNCGYLMGGYSEWDDDPNYVEPSVWQILGYKIQEGDQFKLAVDSKNSWTADWFDPPLIPTLKMSLFYVAVGGARQELASQEVALTGDIETYVLDVPDVNDLAIGRLLGIELQNVTELDSWINVYNVSLID